MKTNAFHIGRNLETTSFLIKRLRQNIFCALSENKPSCWHEVPASDETDSSYRRNDKNAQQFTLIVPQGHLTSTSSRCKKNSVLCC
jgi:hypothetical protein